MALRPILFSIPSTTELKVTFTEEIAESLAAENFFVESLNGSAKDLEVVGVEINDNVVIVKTRPQISGNYYLLKFLDTENSLFLSKKGNRLIDDSVSRELFFVGIDTVNPFRDRMYRKLPQIFDSQNTVLGNILSAEAEELYRAQKDIGKTLSDNYISELVVDEPRTRTAGAFDRLANENAYEITRVSRRQTSENLSFGSIIFDSSQPERINKFPYYPISLQQEIVLDEEISVNTDNNSFDGFLLNLSNRNIIKLLSLKIISPSDVEDCDGNIGTEYNIEKYKYSIKNNFYDQKSAFSFSSLEDNQIMISEFGNIKRPDFKDKIIISYVYKDIGKIINLDTLSISRVEFSENESVPSNSTSFFLENAPVVNSKNSLISKNGLTFRVSENNSDVPAEFKKEIVFDAASLPSRPGEYSVNYETGQVFVYGSDLDALGTGRNNYIVRYNYRKEFAENTDYALSDQDIVALPGRDLSGKDAEITFSYESVFAEGVDYALKNHIEVMPEFVENRINQSFSVYTKNTPITNVFRILNQTTGEVYNPLYFSDSEIFFTGTRSPEIKSVIGEKSNYSRENNEKLEVIGEFIVPAFTVRITSSSSHNSIEFEPPIPAELISKNSNDYFIRTKDTSDEGIEVEDVLVRFFGDADGNNLINSLGINSTATKPAVNSTVIIGNKGYIVNLKNERIVNNNGDALAAHVNTSANFSNKELFSNEKYFKPISTNPGFNKTINDNITFALKSEKNSDFYQNLSRLRVPGDYCIDYKFGVVYLAVKHDQDINIGNVSYNHAKHNPSGKNVLNVSSVTKKRDSADEDIQASIIYSDISNDSDSIYLLDIEDTLEIYDGDRTAADLDGNIVNVCEVQEDYTVVVEKPIVAINSIFTKTDLLGKNLNSSLSSDRIKESSSADLNRLTVDGGKNLYLPSSINFTKNVIDLKKTISKRAYLNSDDKYQIVILDKNIEKLVGVKRVFSDSEFFDEKLNITKINNVFIANVEEFSGYSILSIDNEVSVSEISTENFVLDSEGNRFVIESIDTLKNELRVSSPAENNIEADSPVLGSSKIVVKPTLSFTLDGLTILIPSDAPISNGERFDIQYLTTSTPDIGTALVIDYRYGEQYFDYNYVNDEIVVWYEYGDNAIDWSISNALQEGENYFVTYRYGALRESLRRNFGSLTNIPFFSLFSLNIDRELYRDALAGTLQTFPKGPTIPAFKQLVSSVTKIDPEIKESAFGNWILGRDYSNPNIVDYEGVLEFRDGKFNDGLVFNDDVVVSVPSISSVPLNEGTLECWIRPDWSGISNDATLDFHLENIGKEKFALSPNENPFNFGFKTVLFENTFGGTDSTGSGTRIFNYRTDNDSTSEFSQGRFAIVRENDQASFLTETLSKCTIKIETIGFRFNDLVRPEGIPAYRNFDSFSFIYSDGSKEIGLIFGLDILKGFDYEITELTLDSEDIANFDPPYETRGCSCSFTNNISSLSNINNLEIELSLASEYDITADLLDYYEVSSSASSFLIADEEGFVFDILRFEYSDGTTGVDLSENISKIFINKNAVNYPSLTSNLSDSINEFLPKGKLSLFAKTIRPNFDNSIDSEIAFSIDSKYLVNWSDYKQYRIERNPSGNLVKFGIDDRIFTAFYSDFNNISSELRNTKGLVLGSFDSEIIVESDILRESTDFYNYLDLNDIYIGASAFNPPSMPFSLNKSDLPSSPIGKPFNIEEKEGFFIWYDELCKNPFSEEVGQWVFRTRGNRRAKYPRSVIVNGYNDYEIIYEDRAITKDFSGEIFTDGEFSSVARSHREEIFGSCDDGEVCSSTFRYCGNELLEDFGWTKLDESSSDLINVVVGGTETQRSGWVKHGSFNTSVSNGIYRAGSSTDTYDCVDSSFESNMLYTQIPCGGGDIEYKVSLKVDNFANTYGTSIGEFTGFVEGNLTGITPIHLNDGDINVKVSFAIGKDNQKLILLIDAEDNKILDIISYMWNDGYFHEYSLIKDESSSNLDFYIDEMLLSRTDLGEFSLPDLNGFFTEPHISLYLVDGELVNSEQLYSIGSNTISIDLLFFSGLYIEGDGYLESNDFLLNTDSRIQFKFTIDDQDILDAYDGYDGYAASLFASDEMLISSDKIHYIVDSGESEASNRFSIFKDGKGFLNFRIYDNSLNKINSAGLYNVSTNIKDFKSGELHHVAVSWKLNSIEERDQMHLFVDGQESANIYKFGGKIPVAINDKFSDISKESLQNFLVKDIEYCDRYTDGTTLAGSSIFTSFSANFSDDMVGRSIIVESSSLYPTLIGQQLIIKSVVDSNRVIFGSGKSLNTFVFDTSTSDIEFIFAPYAGIKSPIMTDLRNSRFGIYITDNLGNTSEIGGVLYQVTNGSIDIISGDNVIEPLFRANVDTRIIEFVGRDSDCNYTASVNSSDIDVHIRTFGLNTENCRFNINLKSSSFDSTSNSATNGLSILRTRSAEPVHLSDVKIRRTILSRTALEVENSTSIGENKFLSTFQISLQSDDGIYKISSEPGEVWKENQGRYLELLFDSDNVNFCDYINDGYDDGYSDGENGTITVFGTTVDGSNQETFYIRRNGKFRGNKLFKTVTKIEGRLEIIDEDYFELGVIELKEADTLDIANNGGPALEVNEYKNGIFVLTTLGSGGTFPYELHPGEYSIEYPAFLRISLPSLGDRLFIGSDFSKSNQFNGAIDEFRVISEMSSDTRITEISTSGTRSVTEDFNRTTPFCPDEQTTCLIPFDNPIEKQLRTLRRKEFLNEEDNFKFKLTSDQISSLLSVINDGEKFIVKMINFGFSRQEALSAFYEAHKAEGGPLYNDSIFYRNNVEFVTSSGSVNSSFGNSGIFVDGRTLLLSNDMGYFRANEGTIEFWVSPILDTDIDKEKRYYIDISSTSRERVTSSSSNTINLNSPAKSILSVKLLNKTKRLSSFYTESEKSRILFDEISRSEISGRLEGGTGTGKDFSYNSKLSHDGKRIILSENLPGENVDVIVTYIPLDSSGDRISIFKDEFSQIVFAITADGVDHVVTASVDWKKNTWHRVMCTYKTNSRNQDTMKIFADGKEGGIIKYGTGIIYGTGYVYGQFLQHDGQSRNKEFKINLGNDLKIISVGSDIFGDNSVRARLDNLRFSRIQRQPSRDSAGNLVDLNYSSNINTVSPVIKDDATTYIQNFDEDGKMIREFAKIIDPINGIFEFDVDIIDNFNKVISINNGEIEDLLIELINRLKPAHTNAIVKFKKTKC